MEKRYKEPVELKEKLVCGDGNSFPLRQWGPDPVPPSAIEICRRQRLTSPKTSFLPLHTKWSTRALVATTMELRWQFFHRTDHMEKPGLFKQVSHMVGAQTYVCPVRNCKDLFRTETHGPSLVLLLGCSAVRKTEWRRWTCVTPLLHRCSLTSDKKADHSIAHDDTWRPATCVASKLFSSRRAHGLLQTHSWKRQCHLWTHHILDLSSDSDSRHPQGHD